MIDVIFLLLIFFLLTAKFRPVEDFLLLDIPQARSASLTAVEPFEIRLSQNGKDCKLSFDKQEVVITPALNYDHLKERIQDVIKSQSRYLSDPVEITSGKEVNWQYIAAVYDALSDFGFTNISFNLAEGN